MLIADEVGRLTISGIWCIPEVSHLDIQFRNGSVHVLSNRTLSINRERCSSGPLNKFAPDYCVWFPGMSFQFDFNVSLLFRLFHEGVQILTAENLNDKWC